MARLGAAMALVGMPREGYAQQSSPQRPWRCSIDPKNIQIDTLNRVEIQASVQAQQVSENVLNISGTHQIGETWTYESKAKSIQALSNVSIVNATLSAPWRKLGFLFMTLSLDFEGDIIPDRYLEARFSGPDGTVFGYGEFPGTNAGKIDDRGMATLERSKTKGRVKIGFYRPPLERLTGRDLEISVFSVGENIRGGIVEVGRLVFQLNWPTNIQSEASRIRDISGKVGQGESNARLTYSNGVSCEVEGSFCFLTTAAVEVVGLPDDCWELQTLRRLRDEHLAITGGGRLLIGQYYAEAPSLVGAINALQTSQRIWLKAYFIFILPCALLIQVGLTQSAIKHYRALLKFLREQTQPINTKGVRS